MKQTALRILFSLLFSAALHTHAQKIKMDREPAWVTNTQIDYSSRPLDSEARDGYIDLGFEKQVSIEQQATYYKASIKILSETGVQNKSEVTVNFDPAYQQVIFHSIRIIRGTTSQNRLMLSRIKTVQQEKDLDRFVYNGMLSAITFLEDVRKGDILEYSYTIKGFNPIFGGRYSGFFETGFSVPVYHLYYKLITPLNRPLTTKNNGSPLHPAIASSNGQTTYEWKLSNLAPLQVPGDLPAWYDPYPMIMASEFPGWKEVNAWALSLFTLNEPLSPALRNKVTDIQHQHATAEARLLAALRFVQDEVRYLGIEMGVNSHQPRHPNQVFAQRYGDCKDKTYLLCTLLKNLGIDAAPVLVNTSYKQAITGWLPTPTAFDHVAIRVELDQQVYWLDPTLSLQRGSLSAISFPDYQVGLVVTDTTTSLTAIPATQKGLVKIKEIFNLKDLSGKAQLQVLTHYSGAAADAIRADFQGTSRSEMLKTYLNFYEAAFKNIQADSLAIADDEKTGVFTTEEYYSLDSLWGEHTYMKNASFAPYVIQGLLQWPKEKERTHPFRLRFPIRYEEEIQINLPEPWPLKTSSEQISCAAFQLLISYTCIGRQVVLKCEYQTLKDHVTPSEMEDYLSKLEKAEQSMSYILTSTKKGEEGAPSSLTSLTSNYYLLYVMLGLCVFISYMMRRR